MKWLGSRKPDPIITDVVTELRALREAFASETAPEAASGPTSIQLVERMDSLENRFEELRGTCLRHLQSASQRMKRAEDLADIIDDDAPDSQPVTVPLVTPNGQPEQPEGEDDLRWAQEMIRARGTDPIV